MFGQRLCAGFSFFPGCSSGDVFMLEREVLKKFLVVVV